VIEVSRIQSHSEPRRFLKQHVAEILAASAANGLRFETGSDIYRLQQRRSRANVRAIDHPNY